MAVFGVVVDVATIRPPACHGQRRYLLDATGPTEALLLACQWAASEPGVVMPVTARRVTFVCDGCGEARWPAAGAGRWCRACGTAALRSLPAAVTRRVHNGRTVPARG